MLRLTLEKTLNLLASNGAVNTDKLEGSTIALNIPELNVSLFFVCINARIHVLEAQQQSPDVDISLNRSAFLSLFKGKELKDLITDDEVIINGNVKIAQALADLFAETSLDIEELVSQHTGDIVAHQLGRAVSFIKESTNNNATEVFDTLKDTLSNLLVAPSRSHFFNGGSK